MNVIHILRCIRGDSQVGKALVDGINGLRGGKTCRIYPAQFLHPDRDKNTATFPDGPGRVRISYNPFTWIHHVDDKLMDPTGKGYDAPDVLFHELVHAFLQLAEIFRAGEGQEWGHFDNREDFYAILFTNIYISEMKGKSPAWAGKMLRGDHRTNFTSLTDAENKPVFDEKGKPIKRDPIESESCDLAMAFKNRYSGPIDALFDPRMDNFPMRNLVEQIRLVKCAFNPLEWKAAIPWDSDMACSKRETELAKRHRQ